MLMAVTTTNVLSSLHEEVTKVVMPKAIVSEKSKAVWYHCTHLIASKLNCMKLHAVMDYFT